MARSIFEVPLTIMYFVTIGRPFYALAAAAAIGGTGGFFIGKHYPYETTAVPEWTEKSTNSSEKTTPTEAEIVNLYIDAFKSGELQFNSKTLNETFKDIKFPIIISNNGKTTEIPGISTLGIYIGAQLAETKNKTISK